MINDGTRSPGRYADEPILQQARQGAPLSEFIFDAHGHIGPWLTFYIPRTDAASLVEVMDRCGVNAIAVSATLSIGPGLKAGNEQVAAAASEYPGRFVGYVTVNPNRARRDNEAELERWLGGSHPWMRGIKLHPSTHAYPVTGPGYEVAFEAARRFGIPVLSHTWGEGEEAALCGPALFDRIAERYPEVPVLLGHSGGRLAGHRAAIEVAKRHPNLYLETCGSLQGMGVIEYMVDEVGPERIVYGSDASFLALTAGLGRILYSKLSTEEKRMVLGLNAARLFRYSLT